MKQRQQKPSQKVRRKAFAISPDYFMTTFHNFTTIDNELINLVVCIKDKKNLLKILKQFVL